MSKSTAPQRWNQVCKSLPRGTHQRAVVRLSGRGWQASGPSLTCCVCPPRSVVSTQSTPEFPPPAGSQSPVKERVPNEADLSTQPDSSQTNSWFPTSYEYSRRPSHPQTAARKGAKAPHSRGFVEVTVFHRPGRFQRADRLLSSRDFDRVKREGGRHSSRAFVLLATSSTEPKAQARSRLGLTVSRRVGNAIVRNQIKRGMREWFRCSRERFERPLDLVIIARVGARALLHEQLTSELDRLMARMETQETT